MSCGMLNLHNKKILLVGGGRRAYKTAGEFIEDGAILTCISTDFIPNIESLHIEFIQKKYAKEDIKNEYFMVYALTDDREVNHKIVLDANEKGIISASYHKDEEATFTAMKYQQYDDLTVALSTSGKYPAFTKTVFDEIEKVYTKRYEERLKHLGIVRDYIMKENIEQKYLLKDLLNASVEELKFYSNAIRTNKAFIFVFHGVKQQEMYSKILRFIEAIGYDNNGVYFSYIDDEALKQYHYFEEMNRILSLDSIKKTLQLLKIKDVIYQPMVFEKGNNYHKMMEILKGERINDLLFNDHMLEVLLLDYLPSGNTLLVLPQLSSTTLKKRIEALRLPNVWVMMQNDEIPSMNKKGTMNLVGLFMLIDEDIIKKVFGKKGIFVKLFELDYDAEADRKILLEDETFREYIKTHMVI